MKPRIIRFMQWDCIVIKANYGNERIALELIDANDSEPVARATTNLVNENLKEDEVFIKDYSENEGMLNLLMDKKIVSPPIGFARSGWVQIPKCKLLVTDDQFTNSILMTEI